jgi:hypothetical protein
VLPALSATQDEKTWLTNLTVPVVAIRYSLLDSNLPSEAFIQGEVDD